MEMTLTRTTISQLRASAKSLAFAQAPAAPAPAAPAPKFQTLYLPMGTTGEKMIDGKPLRAAQVFTRKDYIADYYAGGSIREGNAGATYMAMFYAIVCLILTIITYLFVSPYVAAVFAFLTGKYWSERMVNYAWAVKWRKGRPLMQTV